MLVRDVFRRDVARPQHFFPTAEGFGAAVRSELGWGMFPASLAAAHIKNGSFVRIGDRGHDADRCEHLPARFCAGSEVVRRALL
jgi:DNA-binding transcriptional LysR family regulator